MGVSVRILQGSRDNQDSIWSWHTHKTDAVRRSRHPTQEKKDGTWDSPRKIIRGHRGSTWLHTGMVSTLHLLVISYDKGSRPPQLRNIQAPYQDAQTIYIVWETIEHIMGETQVNSWKKPISDSLTHHNSENTSSEMQTIQQAVSRSIEQHIWSKATCSILKKWVSNTQGQSK